MSIELGLTDSREEGEDIKDIKEGSLHWKKEGDHKAIKPQDVPLQRAHRGHASNVAKWVTLQGTAPRDEGRQISISLTLTIKTNWEPNLLPQSGTKWPW